MASKTDIANLSIAHLGTAKLIADLETDQSNEAKVCRLFYDKARVATLKDGDFPFTRSFVSLALVDTQPTSEWGYSYGYPADCLQIRRIFSGFRTDASDTRVPYIIGKGVSGKLIYTDMINAEVEFTFDEESIDQFPDEVQLAISYRLAAYTAPTLSRGEPKIVDEMMKMYWLEISKAQANSYNEEQADIEPDSIFIRARL